jgi:hypothetical protein
MTSRYTGPVGKSFAGDRERAMTLQGTARILCQQLINRIKAPPFNGVGQQYGSRRLPDGSIIHAMVQMLGLAPIVRTWIESPVSVSVTVEKLFAPFVFLLRPVRENYTNNSYEYDLLGGDVVAGFDLQGKDSLFQATEKHKNPSSHPYLYALGCVLTKAPLETDPDIVEYENTFCSINGKPGLCKLTVQNITKGLSDPSNYPTPYPFDENIYDVKRQTWDLFEQDYNVSYTHYWRDLTQPSFTFAKYYADRMPRRVCANDKFTFILEVSSHPESQQLPISYTGAGGSQNAWDRPEGTDDLWVTILRGTAPVARVWLAYIGAMLSFAGTADGCKYQVINIAANTTGFYLSYIPWQLTGAVRTVRFDITEQDDGAVGLVAVWDRFYDVRLGETVVATETMDWNVYFSWFRHTYVDGTDQYVALVARREHAGDDRVSEITILKADDGSYYGTISLGFILDTRLVLTGVVFFGGYLLVSADPARIYENISYLPQLDYAGQPRLFVFSVDTFTPGIMTIPYKTIMQDEIAQRLGLSGPQSLEFLPSPALWKNV